MDPNENISLSSCCWAVTRRCKWPVRSASLPFWFILPVSTALSSSRLIYQVTHSHTRHETSHSDVLDIQSFLRKVHADLVFILSKMKKIKFKVDLRKVNLVCFTYGKANKANIICLLLMTFEAIFRNLWSAFGTNLIGRLDLCKFAGVLNVLLHELVSIQLNWSFYIKI